MNVSWIVKDDDFTQVELQIDSRETRITKLVVKDRDGDEVYDFVRYTDGCAGKRGIESERGALLARVAELERDLEDARREKTRLHMILPPESAHVAVTNTFEERVRRLVGERDRSTELLNEILRERDEARADRDRLSEQIADVSRTLDGTRPMQASSSNSLVQRARDYKLAVHVKHEQLLRLQRAILPNHREDWISSELAEAAEQIAREHKERGVALEKHDILARYLTTSLAKLVGPRFFESNVPVLDRALLAVDVLRGIQGVLGDRVQHQTVISVVRNLLREHEVLTAERDQAELAIKQIQCATRGGAVEEPAHAAVGEVAELRHAHRALTEKYMADSAVRSRSTKAPLEHERTASTLVQIQAVLRGEPASGTERVVRDVVVLRSERDRLAVERGGREAEATRLTKQLHATERMLLSEIRRHAPTPHMEFVSLEPMTGTIPTIIRCAIKFGPPMIWPDDFVARVVEDRDPGDES